MRLPGMIFRARFFRNCDRFVLGRFFRTLFFTDCFRFVLGRLIHQFLLINNQFLLHDRLIDFHFGFTGFTFGLIGTSQGIIDFLDLELVQVSEDSPLIQAIEPEKFYRSVKLLAPLEGFRPLVFRRWEQEGKTQIRTDYVTHKGLPSLVVRVMRIGKGPGHRLEAELHGANQTLERSNERIRLRTKFSILLQKGQGLD